MEDNEAIMLALGSEEGKFCADCEYLIGIRWNKDENEKWKCGHPRNAKWQEINLITGIRKREFNYSLKELRYGNSFTQGTIWANGEHGAPPCGREGNWYKLYEQVQTPDLDPAPTVSPKRKKDATPDDLGL